MTEVKDSARNNLGSFHQLAIAQIAANARNPRRHFGEAGMAELAESIREHGVIEPIVVRLVKEGVDQPYEIVAGERRWRAAAMAGLEDIPCRVYRQMDDGTALEVSLVENLCREDIDPIEQAEGYRALVELGLKQKQIGERVKRSQESISNSMRLLNLPRSIQDEISEGRLTASHGEALLEHKGHPGLQLAIAKAAVEENLTTRAVQTFASDHSYELEKAGVLKSLYNAPFDLAGCAGCRDRRAEQGERGDCLNVSCFAEKAKAHEEAEAKELEGLDLVGVSKLRYDAYKWLRPPPAGCRGDCEHRKQAKCGEQMWPVCVDPKCFEQLLAKDGKAKRAEKAASYEGLMEQARERLGDEADLEALGRAAVLVCEQAIRFAKKKNLATALGRIAKPELFDRLKEEGWESGRVRRVRDAALEIANHPVALVRFAAELELMADVGNAVSSDYSHADKLWWLLGMTERKQDGQDTEDPGADGAGKEDGDAISD